MTGWDWIIFGALIGPGLVWIAKQVWDERVKLEEARTEARVELRELVEGLDRIYRLEDESRWDPWARKLLDEIRALPERRVYDWQEEGL
jgi:hypothetical protein